MRQLGKVEYKQSIEGFERIGNFLGVKMVLRLFLSPYFFKDIKLFMNEITSEIYFTMFQKILSKCFRIMIFNTQPTINEVRVKQKFLEM